MDKLTKKVYEMYQQYPFPADVDYKMVYSLSILWFFAKNAPEGKKSFLDSANIMEAGCGTGNTLISLAQMFPASTFTGIDITINSLEIAKNNAKRLELDNISFINKDLLGFDLNKKFDVVFCIGVLHHLANMKNGFGNLVKHTSDEGYLVLWLYGKYGRSRLNLNQKMLETLFGNVPSLVDKVNLTKRILQKTKPEHIDCHFNVPDSKIEDDWERSLEFVLNNDAWLVDQFLHYNEKTVSMNEILEFVEDFSMELVHWDNVLLDINKYIDDEEVAKLYTRLSHKQKLLVLDYLLKPNYYLIILKKRL